MTDGSPPPTGGSPPSGQSPAPPTGGWPPSGQPPESGGWPASGLPPEPSGRRRLDPWQWAMIAVAAIAAVVLVAVVVWPDGDDDEVAVVDTTAGATTAPPVVTVPTSVATTPATAPPTTPGPTTAPPTTPATTPAPPTTPPPPQVPGLAVAVTQDGRLVVLDTSSGSASEVRELDRGPDPRVPVDEGAPAYLGAPSLAPDGSTVHYHFCCEPVVGDLFTAATDGSGSERRGYGSDPAVSADGARLAFVAYDAVVVEDLATGAQSTYPDPDFAGTIIDLAWTADGAALLYVRGSELVRLDLASGEVASLATGEGWLAHPLDQGGTVTFVQQCCYDDGSPDTLESAQLVTVGGGSAPLPQPVLDRQLSADGAELRTYQDGSLVWLAGGQEGVLGGGFTAADW